MSRVVRLPREMRATIKSLEDSLLGALDDGERASLRDFLQRIAANDDHRFE